ncbi:ABC transporter ATP-binding protein [Aminobacter sp. BE322]|uniref:ABC transporter ATP-binding protein n=1 Tax=unclassified Aminobacter TaxID=2644704 RepID=UPI003D236671
MPRLNFESVTKTYGSIYTAVHGFDLEIADGEFVVFLGPSGCGKSTLLRMVAGLEDVSGGRLLIDGRVVNEVDAKDRNLTMVFQDYALFPHMTVAQNIGYGLKVRGVPKPEIRDRVKEAAERVNLGALLERVPGALSGGQRQRVALARAIVRHAPLILMDEPLSNLDAKLRIQMRNEITSLHRELGTTTIYVTHDQTEAMTMANRIVVMKDGKIQQVGSPSEIYSSPANTFVASFIGSPPMNLLSVELSTKSAEDILPSWLREKAGNGSTDGRRERITLGIRPEDVSLERCRDDDVAIAGEIVSDELLGPERIVGIRHAEELLFFRTHPSKQSQLGARAQVYLPRSRVLLFNPGTGERLF